MNSNTMINTLILFLLCSGSGVSFFYRKLNFNLNLHRNICSCENDNLFGQHVFEKVLVKLTNTTTSTKKLLLFPDNLDKPKWDEGEISWDIASDAEQDVKNGDTIPKKDNSVDDPSSYSSFFHFAIDSSFE